MKKKLTVLILQYNSADLTIQLLESIEKFESKNKDSYRFILMDNASVDPKFEKISDKFPWIELIGYNKNYGFARAHNIIMGDIDEDWVLLLNNDCILINDAITKTLNDAVKKKCDFATCDLRNVDMTFQCNYSLLPSPLVRVFLNTSGLTRLINLIQRYVRCSFVGYINGAFLLIRVDTIPGDRLFDDKYFMYTEDLDLMFRLSKVGAKGYRFSSGKCIHLGGKSAANRWTDYEIEKKKKLQTIDCMYKHFSAWQVDLMQFVYRLIGKPF